MTSPERVAQHSFYPFIRFELIASKFKPDDSGKKTLVRKERIISYASHVDSNIYSYYSDLLSEKYEVELEKHDLSQSILAFRSLGLSNIDFANNAFDSIAEIGDSTVIALDIKGFFDNLSHRYLKRAWGTLIGHSKLPLGDYAVFKSLTSYAYVDKRKIFSILNLSLNNPPNCSTKICSAQDFREKIRGTGHIQKNEKCIGIPQGSAISAMLSNLYMLEFDIFANRLAKSMQGRYYRYCDDMLFIFPGKYESIEDKIETELGKYELPLNRSKTEIHIFETKNGKFCTEKPLQYLGFYFDGQRKFIRSAAFAKFSNNMRRGVSLAKQTARKHNRIREKKGESIRFIWKRKIYKTYTHLGGRNFITYGIRAAEKMKDKTISRQIKRLWGRVNREVHHANREVI
ncbi:hypothetical protein GCM10010970_30300 [Silvimonas iriomotensis]|uniref:Reverse transcriptase domain-containing protein n=1 Tax=Silvimonas iriomotensis TaxID=449662 RepID=A0ABQ2PBZ0_9NEIS|nr:hypothetical protein GCM10010970_30300 [Silvimonas iriomotensis]